ncbi:MAG: tol-pal system-associated acyl-CoA thioesterase [Gammaproteobacteria bacterium]
MTDFLWPLRVYYEDTDSGGVVYYANYLKFMERARTEWLRSLGFEQDELASRDDVLFAVRRAEVDFRRPARFNDALTIRTRIVDCRRASLIFEQHVVRDAQEGELLCSGRIQVACLEASRFRPRPIPERLLREIDRVS